jgi:hypothetical protein
MLLLQDNKERQDNQEHVVKALEKEIKRSGLLYQIRLIASLAMFVVNLHVKVLLRNLSK